MSGSTVIVFGPTGGVGHFVALTAQAKGARVVLAMRDTSKAIPGLTPDAEKSGNYTRVHADFSKPDTIVEAVRSTNAKRAFIYLNFGSPDGMKSTLEALKSAGIVFVVFLSSSTVSPYKNLTDIKPEAIIPYAHAQVEIKLAEVFGAENFVALRPGGFATNPLMFYKDGIKAGEVEICRPETGFDNITPDDMGTVGGTILVDGPKDGQRVVYLFGPEIISQNELYGIIGRLSGHEIKVTAISMETAIENFKAHGLPPPLAEYLGTSLQAAEKGGAEESDPVIYREGVDNIEKYTGRKALRFEPWAQKNKHLFP